MTKRICLPTLVSALLLSLLATGCTSDADRLAAFLQERRTPVSGVPYRVLPPDVILVRSSYVPEIDGIQEQIRPDGKINLPLVGEIDVVGTKEIGLTPKEIEAQITLAAREFYERVDATVHVVGYNSQRVYVFGQVSRPGPQSWTGTNTLLEVLANCQPTQLAWPERILLVRGQMPRRGGYLLKTKDLDDLAAKGQTGAGAPEPAGVVLAKPDQVDPEGQEPLPRPGAREAHVMRVNMMAIVRKGDMSKNVYLQPDDVIYVPANPLAAIGLAIQQILMPIRPAAEMISVPASAATSAARVGGGQGY
ncbi:MAG TPA: polysaccharide biosynthesis/export family protein [Phycisphaerae bacterium]|nr:polysaccharide biosynthesis/export family protein [Phycisphaerae bacterium]